MTGTRPHISHKRLAISGLHPVVAGCSLVVDEVARLSLHTRVDHVDRFEVAAVQVVVESLRIWELLRIKSKNAIAIHVVDVHPDDVGRNLMLAQQVGNLHHPCVGLIAEATLLIAERPQRR